MKYFQVNTPFGTLYYVQNKDGEFRDSSFIGSHFKTFTPVKEFHMVERDMSLFEDSFIDAMYVNKNPEIVATYQQSLTHV